LNIPADVFSEMIEQTRDEILAHTVHAVVYRRVFGIHQVQWRAHPRVSVPCTNHTQYWWCQENLC